jgi:NTE family protein
METSEKKFGVALSGGGYRAATYHLGTLRALNEIGALDQIDVLATNSGGSITGAYYSIHTEENNYPKIEQDFLNCLRKNTITRALLHPRCLLGAIYILGLLFLIIYSIIYWPAWMTFSFTVVFFISIILFQFVIFPISKGIQRAYDSIFFNKKKLNEITARPQLVMNATNVQTGKLWTFSKHKMDDSTYSYDMKPPVEFKTQNFPISVAVSASSCVPFAFNPVKIQSDYFLKSEDTKRAKPLLVDGGVYDNQGLHKLIQFKSDYKCDIILVSDAGAGLKWKSNQKSVITLLIRMLDVLMLRIKNQQMISGVFENTNTEGAHRQIGYFSLAMPPEETVEFFIKMFKKGQLVEAVINAQGLQGQEGTDTNILIEKVKNNIGWNQLKPLFPNKEELAIAQAVGTNLWPLKQKQTNALIKHAYVMTKIFLPLYCPSLIAKR